MPDMNGLEFMKILKLFLHARHLMAVGVEGY